MSIVRRFNFACPYRISCSPGIASSYLHNSVIHTSATRWPVELDEQRRRLEAVANEVIAPSQWEPKKAHNKKFVPSMNMLLWAYAGNESRRTKPNQRVLKDKETLIREIPLLLEKKEIFLSDDITLLCEGCDTGDYLPFLFAAFTQDGRRQRIIRTFLTNGSDEMVKRASRAAYQALNNNERNRDMIHGGICDAYLSIPSESEKFITSQKIFPSFRMGIVGSYSNIREFLSTRIQAMNSSGFCCLSMLLDTGTGLNCKTLMQEHNNRLILENGDGYTELFKPIRYEAMHAALASFNRNNKQEITTPSKDDLSQSIRLPIATIFTENAIHKLVDEVGGEIISTSSKNPIHTVMDSGKSIDVYGFICRPRKLLTEF